MVGTAIEFGILGPLEVRLDGVPVWVGGARQRALLAMFLCNANRIVSRDRLIDELLSDQSADSAQRMLRVQVSRLRKVLGAERDGQRLTAKAPGYVLRVEPGELDLHEFERLLNEGRSALERPDPAHAAMLLGQAESIWRGRPMADLEFEPFAQVEVQRLEELRLVAVEERIKAELELGRHAALCPELEALVAEHPLRERLRAQLMLALYRSGRQADALSLYRDGRSLLVGELGLEPSRQLRQLEQAILTQDPGLEPSSLVHASTSVAVVSPPTIPLPDISQEPRSRAAPRGHPRRRMRMVVLPVLFVAAAVVGLVFSGQFAGTARAVRSLRGNLVALISPGGMVRATVRLQAPPTDITSGFGSLWVAEPGAGVVVRIDPHRRVVIATIPVGARPTRIAVAAGRLWVLDPMDSTLSQIDPGTDTVAQVVRVGHDPSGVVSSAGRLWVADHRDGSVLGIDPDTGAIRTRIQVGGGPSGLAAVGDTLWVANDQSETVERIDARTATVTARIRAGDDPAALAANRAAVWVLDPLDATVLKIDPRRDVTVAVGALSGAPTSLILGERAVWVSDQQHGTLFRIDSQHAAVRSAIAVGDHLRGLAVAGGLWVAADAAGPSHRGGVITDDLSGGGIDTIDPAGSNSPNVAQLFALTNDGLVTLDHAEGAAGTRLLPDLALALPVAADNGLTYKFQLRPGIQYSTGALIRPIDVTHSFERLFELGSSGSSYYQAISGAAACSQPHHACDLSNGIVADNAADTVTFHLTRPDPDFLYKLTLPYADVVPGTTPAREARAPLPATGPYELDRYIPGREALLVRNPRFSEWSAAAQPAGYPDRIVIRDGLNGPQATAAVASGKADLVTNVGGIPSDASNILKHHPSQVHVNPAMGTSFMFLNVRTAPFNDIRVRQALNLALDRTRIVDSYGGPLAALPTCQVLPPGIPGYRRYCPYTRKPGPDGHWHTPDLSQARRLVAASNTTGMTVTVWNTPGPPGAIAETEDAVTALKQLGYRASLRILPGNTYYTYTNDSRNHAQVIDGGWSADYPSANDFIGKLTCKYFLPRNGPATTDGAEFCDSAFDRQIARAASLQTSEPVAATTLWARLDRELTDLAIWLPTVTANVTGLTSKRIGDYQYNPVWGPLLDQMWVR